ncbi:MAG TPA: acyl--CoA ligase [Candidatus Choladousia intestinigallinarum]|nr:acyl--CoA ligase [Candidatus Choladousia intestinigallinarum]
MYNSIAEAVIHNSRRFPGKVAVADSDRQYTYQELKGAAIRGAKWLKSKEVQPGDFVIVECTQNAAFVVLNLACGFLGAVFVPVEKKAAAQRVSNVCQTVRAKCIIGRTDYSQICTFYDMETALKESEGFGDEEEERFLGRAAAEILFTTGTTGQPKGIVLSDAANLAVAENISSGVEMTPDTTELIPLPLSHSHGLRTCYANLFTGSTCVLADGVMNVGLFFKLIETYHVNALDLSPTLAKLLLKIARKGLEQHADSIRYIEIGTAVLEDDTKEQLKELFPEARLYNFYGSTEAGRSCVLDFNRFDDTGCIGYPSKNASFFIVDDQRRVIESSRENPGLLAVSGSMMMEGYFDSEELTKKTLVDGVLYTSDLGYIDQEGRIYVIGRQDDVINYKGIKIAPEEIEQTASRYTGVKDCCCVPMEDPVCGQVPKLFVSVLPSHPFDKKDFMTYLRKNLEPGRVPAAVELIDQIPRSSNGKILRKRLRER